MTNLPDRDLCHHAEYRIYIDGQYAESVGSKAEWASKCILASRDWHRRKEVTFKATECKVEGCLLKFAAHA